MLEKFIFFVDSTEAFPKYDGGNVIFQRESFIKSTVDMILTKKTSKFDSYFWRAPFGSGKTVFLKLLGKELQKRECDVYYLDAKKLDIFPERYFIKLANNAGDRTVVLLIDEVQINVEARQWIELLKGLKPSNLFALGVP